MVRRAITVDSTITLWERTTELVRSMLSSTDCSPACDGFEFGAHGIQRALRDLQRHEGLHVESGGGHVDLRIVGGDHPRLLHPVDPGLHGRPRDLRAP
jgi:hypothetical protein